jgi:hypothetical protein
MKRFDELKILFADAEGRMRYIYSKASQTLVAFGCPEAMEFRPAKEMMAALKEIAQATEVYVSREERASLAKIVPSLQAEKSGLSEEEKERILRGGVVEGVEKTNDFTNTQD